MNVSYLSDEVEKNVLEADRHLVKADAVMARLVSDYGPCPLGKRQSNPFHTLARSIISQQLSAKAADTIERRVSQITPAPFSPDEILTVPIESLRGAGLSTRKAGFIRQLAVHITTGRLNFDELAASPDESVIIALMELPGIGRWTAEMFLIFGLKRPDVIALGDAGLKRAAKMLYQDFDENGGLEQVSGAWRPYRSIASWYLWRHLDVVG